MASYHGRSVRIEGNCFVRTANIFHLHVGLDDDAGVRKGAEVCNYENMCEDVRSVYECVCICKEFCEDACMRLREFKKK